MKRIFISTNYTKLYSVIGTSRNDKCISYLQNHKWIFYDLQSESFSENLTTTTDLILINDNVAFDQNVLRPNNGHCERTNDFLMRHSICSHNDDFDEKNIHRKGQHEEGDYYYKTVFDFILDEHNKKAERILEFLFPDAEKILDIKLNLLHHCLTPEGAKHARDVDQYDLIKAEVEKVTIQANGEIKKVIDYLAQQNDCFNEDKYLKPLSELRDAVLEN